MHHPRFDISATQNVYTAISLSRLESSSPEKKKICKKGRKTKERNRLIKSRNRYTERDGRQRMIKHGYASPASSHQKSCDSYFILSAFSLPSIFDHAGLISNDGSMMAVFYMYNQLILYAACIYIKKV